MGEDVSVQQLDWLWANRVQIIRGGAHYQNVLVTPETKLVSYRYVWSAVFVTSRSSTPRFIAGSVQARSVRRICQLITGIFGWWGVPRGLFWTIDTLLRNAEHDRGSRVIDYLFWRDDNQKSSPLLNRQNVAFNWPD